MAANQIEAAAKRMAISREAAKLADERKRIEASIRRVVQAEIANFQDKTVVVTIPDKALDLNPVTNVTIPPEAITVSIEERRPPREYTVVRNQDGQITRVLARDSR